MRTFGYQKYFHTLQVPKDITYLDPFKGRSKKSDPFKVEKLNGMLNDLNGFFFPSQKESLLKRNNLDLENKYLEQIFFIQTHKWTSTEIYFTVDTNTGNFKL